MGGLAEQLGVTKGSVSELLRRLERKGLAYKAKDPLKLTRLNVFLTEKGKAAHKQHMDFHSQLDCMVDDAMAGRIQLEPFVTHTMPLTDINESFDLMHEGKSIRSVVHY